MRWRRNREDDLERELRAHLDLEAEEARDGGLAPADARAAARRAFGNVGLAKESVREAWGGGLWRQAWWDARYGVRIMRRSPVLTAAALLSLALGIGANTAIFSLANAVLRRPLPVQSPEQLERIAYVQDSQTITTISYPIFRELQRGMRTLSGVIGRARVFTSIAAAGGGAQRAVVELVSGNYFEVLGVKPVRGRLLTAEDDSAPMAHRVAVISERYWREALKADGEALRAGVRIGGVSYAVVGVAPAPFFGVEVGTAPDAWIPITMVNQFYPARNGSNAYLEFMGQLWMNALARRAPGVTREEAQAELNVVFARFLTEGASRRYRVLPTLRLESARRGLSLVRERLEEPLLILSALVGLVLLVACANVAGLLTARAAARRAEIGMRIALGAGRGRVMRQLLTESLVLSLMGGVLGLVFAAWGVRFLLGFLPAGQIALVLNVSSDARVLGITLAGSILCGLLFGLAPALHASGSGPLAAVKAPVPSSGGRAGWEMGRVMAGLQVALSLSLVAGAGLFFESLRYTASVDLGMETDHVLTATVSPGDAGYGVERRADYYRELDARLGALPGIGAVGYAGGALLAGGFNQYGRKAPASPESLAFSGGGGDFFAAIGNPMVRGRGFVPSDAHSSKKILVINEALARRDFAGMDPIGRRFKRYTPDNEVVGVARDTRMRGIHDPPMATVYTDEDQDERPAESRVYYLRTAGDPARLTPALRRVVRELDANVPLTNIKTLADQKAEAMVRERFTATIAGFFGAVGLLLAGIGLYGVVSYAAVRRTREIGIRMSLGAGRGSVVWTVMRGSLLVAVGGIAAGLPLCLWLSKLASGLLFGVRPNDARVLAGTVAALVAVAAVAAMFPARRAARIDPVQALRAE